MQRSATPIAIFQQQVHRLCSTVPGLLDGRPDSIHDARIATRRIREVLPLTREWQRQDLVDDLISRFRRMGRSLGRVREADVHIELLRHLESRIAVAAPSLVIVRQRQEHERLRLMRKLIKRLERLTAGGQLRRLNAATPWPGSRFLVALTGAWRTDLRHLMAERSTEAGETIRHATGVYFPNRAHQARIALKKFRYASEIGAQTGMLKDEPLIRDLKKAQDILGELHDREVLVAELKAVAPEDDGVDAGQIRLVKQVAEAEIEDLHRRFLERRYPILESCARVHRAVRPARVPAGTIAVAGVLAITGFEALRRGRLRASNDSGLRGAVTLRVPVPLHGHGIT